MNFVARSFYENSFVVNPGSRSQFRAMADDLKRTIAFAVKASRQRMRLTQEELAARVNRTPESISNIERGLHLPSVETLVDLGRELKIPVSEFFEQDTSVRLTHERAKLEATLREIGRSLPDRELKIAVRLLGVALEISGS